MIRAVEGVIDDVPSCRVGQAARRTRRRPLLRLAAAALAVVAASCGGAEPGLVLHEDLLPAFADGEFVRTTRYLAFGSPRGRLQTVEADRRRFWDSIMQRYTLGIWVTPTTN